MKLLQEATNGIAILCHLTDYQQLTVEHAECHSLDSKNRYRTDKKTFVKLSAKILQKTTAPPH